MKKIFLIAAGVDPSGAAGIAVDIATARDFALAPSLLITAFTIQERGSPQRVLPRSPRHFAAECASLIRMRPGVVKIGMIPDDKTVKILSESLQILPNIITILDPILCASSGLRLISAAGFKALQSCLLPGSIVTPNIAEASALSGITIRTDADREKAARVILTRGACAVVIKGGHGTNADDLVATKTSMIWLNGKPILDRHGGRVELRGTGCRFSTALAAGIALRLDLDEAARGARRYVRQALRMKARGA